MNGLVAHLFVLSVVPVGQRLTLGAEVAFTRLASMHTEALKVMNPTCNSNT